MTGDVWSVGVELIFVLTGGTVVFPRLSLVLGLQEDLPGPFSTWKVTEWVRPVDLSLETFFPLQ